MIQDVKLVRENAALCFTEIVNYVISEGGMYNCKYIIQWNLINAKTLNMKFWVKRTHGHGPCRATIETVQNFTAEH